MDWGNKQALGEIREIGGQVGSMRRDWWGGEGGLPGTALVGLLKSGRV